MIKYVLTAFAFLALSATCGLAQNGANVRQSGNVTPGHVPMWTTNGAIQDGGTASQGFLSSIGVTAQGPGICQNSAPITGPYNRLCLSVSTGSAANISLQNLGGAAAQALNFVINGATYSLVSNVIPVPLASSILTTNSSAVTAWTQTLPPLIPAPGTTNKGIDVQQTGAQTGTQANQLAYNSIVISNDQYAVTNAGQATVGLYIPLITGGSNSDGYKYTVFANLQHTIASNKTVGGDDVVGVFYGQSSASYGGTNTSGGAKGTIYALNPNVTLNSGATNYNIISGGEVDVGIQTGATVKSRLGWSVVDAGTVQAASLYDVGYELYGAPGALGFKVGFMFSSRGGASGVSTTGTMIGTDGVAVTVGHVIDVSSIVTCGNLLLGPSSLFQATCAGATKTTAISIVNAAATVTGLFSPSTDFTNSIEAGTISNHIFAFKQNNVITAYFDTDKSFNLGLAATSQGLLNIHGLTSGVVSVAVQAAAGTFNFNLPITAGTSGFALVSGGGGSAPMTWAALTSGTVTSIATTSPITGGTITTTGTIACATCVTGSTLTANQIAVGANSQGIAVIPTGTGVLTALGVNVGSVGAFVTFNGALGTPSSGVGTNITGVNAAQLGGATFAAPGAIGGGTPAAGTFTVLIGTSITDATAVSGSGALQIVGGASIAKRFWLPAITTSSGLQTAVLCQSSGGEVIADSVACLASSARFKENLAPMPDATALAEVMQLRPHTGRYKPEGMFTNTREHVWFIAEQVAEIDTRLVGYDNGGLVRSVDYTGATVLNTGAIRALKADNDNLRAEIEQLKRANAR